MKGESNKAKIKREEADLARLLEQLPGNPIPWVAVLKLVAPVIARLAVRYALKRVARSLSEDKVNTIGEHVADYIAGIVAKRTGDE